MEVAGVASHFSHTARMLSPAATSATPNRNRTPTFTFSCRASLSTDSFRSSIGGSVPAQFSGHSIRHTTLDGSSGFRVKRSVVSMAIPTPSSQGPPPDLASYLFANRIVYLGYALVPAVTEMLVGQFLALADEDQYKPVFFYINSTGNTEVGTRDTLFETEAYAIYDVMSFIPPEIYTLCVGNAWGEAALLLAGGDKGHRAALPSASIMIQEPIGRFGGQATDVEIWRKELGEVKKDMVEILVQHTGKSMEQIESDLRPPKYFTPTEAVEYGLIDKVIYNERTRKDRKSLVTDLKTTATL